ncbi:MAG: hypothetical protein H7839_14430 [Magnetococcus sp. YQC-5]
MCKKSIILILAVAWSAINPTALQADPTRSPRDEKSIQWEIHGVAKNESAWFNRPGQITNQANATTDQTHHTGGDWLKFENSINLFINGQFTETTSLHSQLNLVYESTGTEGSRSHLDNSQNDTLREFYLDTTLGPVDVRMGKQQEVWGTADGIKLLDILNPTDYREFVQNTLSDSRIPVWMIKASTPTGATGNLQLLLAQHHENRIPGLNASGDPGKAFIMKGVDAITGQVNGFSSITPQLGQVAGTFNALAQGFKLPGLVGVPGFDLRTTTVQDFVDGTGLGAAFLAACPGFGATSGSTTQNADCLNRIAQTTNHNQTLLIDGANWDANHPNSAFEYMNNTTFATFNSFVNATSTYRRNYPDAMNLNIGLRYKNSIGGNFNYSLNYLNHYDPNPYVALSWENGQGAPLTTEQVITGGKTTLHLHDATGAYYGAVDPKTFAPINRPATLVFTEKMNRINSLGGSFDTSVDTKTLGPVVLRGEAIYQINTKIPVVDRTLLSQGDLAGALQNRNADQFKYVLGAEFIAFTNLTLSAQFIQFINLDYVDQAESGTPNSGRYTADPAVMNLTNGLRKASQFKEFGSLFLSKPFGEEQQGRINNLTMNEEQGGWWNRLDGEWKWNDNWVTTAEWNQYWGNENTLFGQFGKMSNIQIGLKYIF